MKYSPVDRTDRDYVGVNWTRKSVRAISAILQITKGVVAAGTDFFYKAFGSSLQEYFEILAMPRELIMFRYHFEEGGATAKWKKLYHELNANQKQELMQFVLTNPFSRSHVRELCRENGFTGICYFTDDGISDTTFDREGLRAMFAGILQ